MRARDLVLHRTVPVYRCRCCSCYGFTLGRQKTLNQVLGWIHYDQQVVLFTERLEIVRRWQDYL